MNKFVRDITVKKHFCSIDNDGEIDQGTVNVDFPYVASCDRDCVYPSHCFEDLITVSYLQSLGIESRVSQIIQPSKNFKTKNTSFYPLQSRTTSIEMFQEKMERDLVLLYDSNPNVAYKNLNSDEYQAIRDLKKLDDIIIR